MTQLVPWKPGDRIPPAKWGLGYDQWVRILHLQHRYATNSHGDRDACEYIPAPTPRLEFAKYLRQTGRLRDG